MFKRGKKRIAPSPIPSPERSPGKETRVSDVPPVTGTTLFVK